MSNIIISYREFRDGARDAVLEALDEYMRDITRCDKAIGARDSDLPDLFAGLDAHMAKIAARFNELDSAEPGSAFFKIE